MLETFDLILGFVDDLLSGRVEIEDLTVIRQVKQTYKSDTYFMKVFADNMRKWGFIVNPGDRLDYLIVQSAIKNEGVANRMRDPITYTNRLGTPEEEKIDYLYYLEHAIQNPIDQLFYVGYKKQMDEMMSMNMGYQPNSKAKNPRYVNEPIKMIVEILSDGKKLDYARKIMFPSLYKKPVIRVAKK
jgi:hypothetical protein